MGGQWSRNRLFPGALPLALGERMVGEEDSTEGELLPPPPLLSKAWLTRLRVHLAISGRTPLRPLCPLPPPPLPPPPPVPAESPGTSPFPSLSLGLLSYKMDKVQAASGGSHESPPGQSEGGTRLSLASSTGIAVSSGARPGGQGFRN